MKTRNLNCQIADALRDVDNSYCNVVRLIIEFLKISEEMKYREMSCSSHVCQLSAFRDSGTVSGGRHVIHSFVPPASPFEQLTVTNLRSTSIFPARHSQFTFQRNFHDGPNDDNQPASGGRTRPGHTPFDREALRAPALQLCRHKYRMMV